MTVTDIHAFHYRTGRPVRLEWNGTEITALREVDSEPEQNVWAAPPLLDLQINGYGGVDFQQDDLTPEQLLQAARALRRDGCARFFFTLITNQWSVMMSRLARARQLRAQSAELRRAIAGWHIEGPFLSERPGFCGAHDPSAMMDPTPEHVRQLREVAGDDPVLLTLAPERPRAIEVIREAAALGITISLGHTDAPSTILAAAVQAGARGFTHLANGCPRELDRHDNIVWRVCECEGLTVSFIPDGIHVSPQPFRLLHRLLSGREIYYTTDAMAAGGASPGRYQLGHVQVEVGADQIVRQPGKSNFAGSALRPFEGVFRSAKMLGCAWQECWRKAAEAPAGLVRLQNSLQAGADAFCLVHPDHESVEVWPR